MRLRRTVPPAAGRIPARDLWSGLLGIVRGAYYTKRLKSELAEYFAVDHVFLVSSGKAALTLILKSLKSLSSRNEVIIPAYTCFSVPSAVVKAGLKVRLCDIDPSSFDFDLDRLERLLNENTLCVVPDHLFGIPSNMSRIIRMCRSRGIFVVEDAAQAMGGTLDGSKLGTLGDIGFFSVGRGKNITSGSGGIIVARRGEIAEALARFYAALAKPSIFTMIREWLESVVMSIFTCPTLFWFPDGLPFLRLGKTVFYKDFPVNRLSGMKAGLLRSWRQRLDQSNRVRSSTADYFSERLHLRTARKPAVPYLRLPVVMPSPEARAEICEAAKARGLGLSSMYPAPVSAIEEIAAEFLGLEFPVASYVAERLLTIPTHELLSKEDKDNICRLFRGVPSPVGYPVEKNADQQPVFYNVQ
jgi:perosamine synthetase